MGLIFGGIRIIRKQPSSMSSINTVGMYYYIYSLNITQPTKGIYSEYVILYRRDRKIRVRLVIGRKRRTVTWEVGGEQGRNCNGGSAWTVDWKDKIYSGSRLSSYFQYRMILYYLSIFITIILFYLIVASVENKTPFS